MVMNGYTVQCEVEHYLRLQIHAVHHLTLDCFGFSLTCVVRIRVQEQ